MATNIIILVVFLLLLVIFSIWMSIMRNGRDPISIKSNSKLPSKNLPSNKNDFMENAVIWKNAGDSLNINMGFMRRTLDNLDLDKIIETIDQPPMPAQKSQPFNLEYLIHTLRSIYINTVIPINIDIGTLKEIDEEKDKLLEKENSKSAIVGKDTINFIHTYPEPAKGQPAPKPKIKVEIKFAEGDFSTNETTLTKEYDEKALSQYTFQVKPLKAEQLNVSVIMSYVGTCSVPLTITEIEETTSLDKKTGTVKTKYSPASVSECVIPIATENIVIDTKSFLNMNASTQKVFTQLLTAVTGLAVLIYITVNGKSTDPVSSWITGGLAILSSIGIPKFTDDWTKLAIQPKEKAKEKEE